MAPYPKLKKNTVMMQIEKFLIFMAWVAWLASGSGRIYPFITVHQFIFWTQQRQGFNRNVRLYPFRTTSNPFYQNSVVTGD